MKKTIEIMNNNHKREDHVMTIKEMRNEINRLHSFHNRSSYQAAAWIEEDLAWTLYESDAVQKELAATRSNFRAEEQARTILEAQNFQVTIADKAVEEQLAVEAAAQEAALEAVMAAWDKAAASARWTYILAHLDRARCAVVSAAEATFMPYIHALMRGYFWVKAQISTAIDAITKTVDEAELELSYLRTQMEEFVFDGQLFAEDEVEELCPGVMEYRHYHKDIMTAEIQDSGRIVASFNDEVDDMDAFHAYSNVCIQYKVQNPERWGCIFNRRKQAYVAGFKGTDFIVRVRIPRNDSVYIYNTCDHSYVDSRLSCIKLLTGAKWFVTETTDHHILLSTYDEILSLPSGAYREGQVNLVMEMIAPPNQNLSHLHSGCGFMQMVEVRFLMSVYYDDMPLLRVNNHFVVEPADDKFDFDLQLFAGDPTEMRQELPGGFIEVTQEWEILPEEAEYGWMAGHHRSQEIFNPAGESVVYWDDLENRDLAGEYSEVRNRIFGFCPYCGEQGCDTVDADGNPAHAACLEPVSDETGSVSIKEDESSTVELESSEVVDNSQATEAVNKEEVNTSVASEKKSVNTKGGINMTEKKAQKKMFAMTKISFVEAKKSNVGFFAYVTESSGEITEATAPFVSTDKPFKATTGSLTKVKAASTQIIELESNFDELRDIQAKTNMAEVAVFRGRQVVDVYYRPQEVFIGKQSGELKFRAASYWVKLTGKLTYDKDTEMYSYEIVNEIPKTARIFTVYQRINTTSQGRKNLMYAFSTTQKRFDKVRDEVTCGMTSKYYGRRVNLKYNADFATRASAHDTHVISNMPVESYVVLFGKNDPTDGNIIANAGYFAEGALDKQIRPYAAKGFCTLWPTDAFKDTLSLYNLKVLVRNNISAEDEAAIDAMLMKGTDKKLAKKHFAGFDGVMICNSEDQIPMLIMNQDAMKAAYDYNRVNGLHVLAEADHNEDVQNLSGQLAKVILQAGAESGHYNEAISLLSNCGVNHVNTYFDKTKEPICVLGWNSDIIQPTMPLSVAAGTLGWDVTKYPYLMKTVLKDKLTRLSRDITRVNFGIEGKYLPAEPDVAAWFGLSVLKTTAEYVEVYVPGMTGYAVLLKYPSTGSNEYVIVRFMSLDEINERIDTLTTDDLRKSIIRRVYASLKSGVCTISSDEVVRRMLAGFDFDGDHVLLVTAPELVEFMQKYGHPIAVYIDAPEDGTDEEIIISSASFAAHAYRMAKTGNRAVGQVVNLGRMFTNAMTALMARATTPAQREIMLGIMRKVFFNSNTYHGIKYESPFVRGELKGIQTVQLNRVMVNNMISKAKHIALTRTNVLAWLRDMDHAFRFYSELTIDAQKNLYEVAIKFAKYMKKSGYRISSNVCALEFAMNLGVDGLITDIALKDSRILKDTVANKKGELKWIGDIMTPIRVAAAEAAMERCMDMATEYNDAVQVANAQRVAKQDEYIAKNDDLFATINLLGRYSGALVRMARTEIANAVKKLSKNVPHTIRQKLMDMAQARIKADFIAANAAITNTYRRIVSDYTTEELVERILAASRGDRMLTDICQEEILKFFLDKENVQYRREIRLADGVSIADVESYVIVEDGAFSNQFGKVGYVGHDVADGIYDTVIEDGHAYIMQMASERIVVPAANDNEFIVLFEGSAANDAAKYFDENNEACFGLNNGGFVGLRDAENIKQKAIMVTNSFSSSKQPIAVSTLFKNLVLNKKIEMVGYKAIAAEYSSDGQQTHKPQLLVICHELGAAPVVEQVIDHDTMNIQNIFGDDLFC